jgi:hypothetical protein
VFWDGESTKIPVGSDVIKYDGLGGLDLLEDSADRFLLSMIEYDFANAGTSSVTVIIYDASDSSGKVFSVQTITLNRQYPNPAPLPVGSPPLTEENLEFPFAAFVKGTNANSAASLSNIGAIEIFVEGTTPGADLSFSHFKTNGQCTHIPVNGLVKDQCGVCNGDNSTCSDCLGVPNGPAVAGTMCDTGDVGVCSSGIYTGKFPSCDCPAPPPGTELCGNSLDDNCDGVIDEVKFDLCGVCGGSNLCLGCDGVPNSGKVPDLCGVCGGSNACLGCDGVPNSGKVLDACNICGGDGKSCAGCDGVSGSGLKTDICGVCGGDGKSCTSECDKTDIRDKIFDLDLQAKEAEKVIVRGTRVLFRNPKAKSLIPNLKKLLVDAHNLQVTNWILSWTLPEIITSCKNDIVCFKSSNVSKLDTYRVNANALLKLNDQAASMLRRVGLGGRARIMERNGRAVLDHALGLAATIPETTTVCNIESSLP